MKLKKPIPEKQPVQTALYDALRKFLFASRELMTVLQQNPVISSDELKEAGRKLVDVKHIIAGVLHRTEKVRPIVENSELFQMDDIQLAVKLSAQENDLSLLVALATTALDRLRQNQHISEREFAVLNRFWMQLPVEHQRLLERWELARDT
jgi:hypothetical protein